MWRFKYTTVILHLSLTLSPWRNWEWHDFLSDRVSVHGLDHCCRNTFTRFIIILIIFSVFEENIIYSCKLMTAAWSLTTLLKLQNSRNIYFDSNIIANNEWGGVRRVVVKGRRRQIIVLAFAYGTEENHNTLSKARERAVEIQNHILPKSKLIALIF
jgi:hypothetical protein